MFGALRKKLSEWIKGTKKKVVETEEKKLKDEEKLKKEEKEIKKEEKQLKKEKEKAKEVEEIKEEIVEEVKERKKGFFARLKEKFTKVKISEEEFETLFNGLKIILLENNVAYEVIEKIEKQMKEKIIDKEINKKELDTIIKNTLKASVEEILIEPFDLLEKIKEKQTSPFVILFFGINGSGKTTTIAKLAHMLLKNNISCVIAAADTFRAASIEQLEKHGKALGVEVIKQNYGADPAAVAFDAIKHAKSRGVKVVLIDSAGRMHTAGNLLNEMKKIARVSQPDLKIFVGESITGNDATEQARKFNEEIGIDGIILSKADVDERGGTSISVGYITKKPILFLGTDRKSVV